MVPAGLWSRAVSAQVDEQQMRTAWDAAVRDCLNGHESCSYGGMTPQSGYWIQDEGCTRDHGEKCTWCGGEAVTGFSGWGDDGFSIYAVPACEGCAQRWAEFDTRWHRPTVEVTPIDAAYERARAVREEFEQRTAARAHELAAELTESLLPDEMRAAGLRFEFSTEPVAD